MFKWLSTPRSKEILFFSLVFLAGFLTRTISHYNLATNYYDQFFFDNPLWNTAHGKFFFCSVPAPAGQCIFGGHFTPILFLFVLPYFIYPSALWMFAFQAAFIAGIALLIYKFAKINLDDDAFKLVLLLLITNVPFRYLWYQDFHPDIIISFLTGLALYILLVKNKPWTAALVILSGFLVKEVAGFIICGFGLYFLCFRKEKLLGAALMLMGVAGTVLIVQQIIPQFNSSGTFMFANYYSQFGSNISEQIINIIAHPLHTLSFLFSPANLLYLFLLLAPLAFLPLFSPTLLCVGLINVLTNLLSNYSFQKDITVQYSDVLLPVLFFSTILAIKSLKEQNRWDKVWKFSRPAIYFFMAISLLAFLLLNVRNYLPSAKVFAFHNILRQIPDHAPLSAADNLLVHRQYQDCLYRFPDVEHADYVLFGDIDWWYYNEPGDDLVKIKKLWQKKDYGRILRLIFMGQGMPSEKEAKAILSFRKNKDFRLLAQDQGFFLYKRWRNFSRYSN